MSRTVQRLLLNIRTDLDSFSDIEAFALMYSGYQMATHQLREQLPELKSREPETLTNWTFLCIGKRIDGSIEDKEINDALRRGATAAFRFSRLLPRLAIGCSAALLVAAAMIGWHFGFGKLLLGVGIVAAGILFPMMAVLRGELFRSPIQPMISLFFLLIGWIPAKIHMRFINDAYLRRGSLRPAKK
jgi:hypothetical protein